MTTAAAPSPPALGPEVQHWLGRLAPEAYQALAGLHEAVWASLEPSLLELVRLRYAQLLDDPDEFARRTPAAALDEAKVAALRDWPTSPLFSAAERSVLALAEQMCGDVAGVTQADVDAVLAHYGPATTYGLVQALYALDFHQRLRLAVRALFGAAEEATA